MEEISLVTGLSGGTPSILAPKLDLRGVCALRQINANGIVLPGRLVIFAKPVRRREASMRTMGSTAKSKVSGRSKTSSAMLKPFNRSPRPARVSI